MVESLRHKELKKEAVKKLKDKGFLEEQLKLEQWVYFDWEGKKRRYKVDVLGDNGNKKVIFQVGNHSKIEIDLLKKYFETYYLNYADYTDFDDEIIEENELTLKDEKREVIKVYNSVEKIFENDEVYDFVKYGNDTENTFKIGRKGPWMILPTSRTISKEEFNNNITITMGFVSNNIFDIGIYAIQKPAVELFLNMLPQEKEKYIEEIKRLPPGYFVYDGFRKKIKHHANWEQYWNEIWYEANTFNEKHLKEIEDRTELLINIRGEELPCICFLYTEVKKDELVKAFKQIRPVYRILRTMKTFDKSIIERIKVLPQWEWHIYENEIEDLYEIYSDKFKDENIRYEDFCIITRKLKKDPNYIKYKQE